MTPQRIQLSRKKGWRLPPNTVVVARPSIFGNPYKVGGIDHRTSERIIDAAHAVRLYIERGIPLALKPEIRSRLRGKNLACWCPLDAPCHADVLLELANK